MPKVPGNNPQYKDIRAVNPAGFQPAHEPFAVLCYSGPAIPSRTDATRHTHIFHRYGTTFESDDAPVNHSGHSAHIPDDEFQTELIGTAYRADHKHAVIVPWEFQ